MDTPCPDSNAFLFLPFDEDSSGCYSEKEYTFFPKATQREKELDKACSDLNNELRGREGLETTLTLNRECLSGGLLRLIRETSINGKPVYFECGLDETTDKITYNVRNGNDKDLLEPLVPEAEGCSITLQKWLDNALQRISAKKPAAKKPSAKKPSAKKLSAKTLSAKQAKTKSGQKKPSTKRSNFR